ncbi:unnamed protein product [Pleuronectes platessa]|uniref:Uncharacterized protein n=1 Tax=Pleuronectes platessa TaxID=8262 RepID=A0A9N7UYT0_PLEPL|nr:unnamed protein product [Pleuronectes platessa]
MIEARAADNVTHPAGARYPVMPYAAGRCPSALRKAGTGWRGPGTAVGGSDSGRVSVPSDHLSYSARWGNPPFARGDLRRCLINNYGNTGATALVFPGGATPRCKPVRQCDKVSQSSVPTKVPERNNSARETRTCRNPGAMFARTRRREQPLFRLDVRPSLLAHSQSPVSTSCLNGFHNDWCVGVYASWSFREYCNDRPVEHIGPVF